MFVHELFEAQVRKTPDNVAITFEGRSLTYGELNVRANRLGHHLQTLGVGPEVPVGICMERSFELVVAILGVLKAGGACVPLDPAYPKERLAFMLDDTQAPVLLTESKLLSKLTAGGRLPTNDGGRTTDDGRQMTADNAGASFPQRSPVIGPRSSVICLDTDQEIIARQNRENPCSEVTSDNLAFVFYTSGSTGTPKAVMWSHTKQKGVQSRQQATYQLTEQDRHVLKSPIGFTLLSKEIFSPLLTGGCMIIAPAGLDRDVAHLVKLIAEENITVITVVPSMLRMLLEQDGLEPCSSLRHVCTFGEALPAAVLERFFRRLNAELTVAYGATEAPSATLFKCSPEDPHQIITLGQPLPEKEIYLLDENLQPTPLGIPGEIYLGGKLARGYLKRPDLTAEKFIPGPFNKEPGARLYRTGDLGRYLSDGNIESLGRIDHQVKIRGFRVELGEIEAVLAQHPAVREAVVLARDEVEIPKSEIQNPKSPGKRLLAYVVPQQEQAPTVSDLRSFVRRKLPDYMVPSAFMFLDALPLMPNGKVNLQALPMPDQTRPELGNIFIAPRDGLELELTKIWEKLLTIKPVGVRDNFFDLGGHSLLAVRLFAQIEKVFRKKLPLSSLFRGATIEHLASMISQPSLSSSWSSLVPIQPQGSKPPFFCVHDLFGDVFCYANLARYLGPDQPFYGMQAGGLDGAEEPLTRLQDMAAHYIKEIQTLQSQGPYFLGGLCAGGVVAFEMAHQLRAKGHRVALLALLDSGAGRSRDGNVRGRSYHNFLRDMPYWLTGLLQLTPNQLFDLVRLKVRVARAKMTILLRSPGVKPYQDQVPTLIRELGDLLQFPEHHRKVAAAQHQALKNYIPQPYPGRVTLFRARMQPFFSSHRPDKGWRKLAAGGLEIKVIPGNHIGMLQEPHVKVLAKELRTRLDEAQRI
jgi:amino acid adenylation domain-containing protein